MKIKQSPLVECLFGPETFRRTTGKPRVESRSVTVTSRVEGPFTLNVFNGAPDGKNRVSSGSVWLNGQEVVSPSDLNQQVGTFERQVTLNSGRNVLEVEVRLESAPGSFLILTLCGLLPAAPAPPTIAIVTPASGSVIPTSTPEVHVDYAGGDERSESKLDLATLRVLLDGADITALLTVAGNTAFGTVDAAHALAEGPHRLQASIVSLAGLSAEATSPFSVDLPPTVEITAEPRQVLVGESVLLTVRARDNRGVTGLHVTVNDESVQLDITVNRDSVKLEALGQAVFRPKLPGPHVAEAIAIDTSGNTATDQDDFMALPTKVTGLEVTVEADPPVVRVGSPVALPVSAASTTEVTSLSLTVDGRAVPLNRQNMGTFVPDREGIFTATALAQDADFNVATASTTFRAVSEDRIPPTVVVTAVPTIQSVNRLVALTVKAGDNVTVAELRLTVEGTPIPLDEAGNGTFVSHTPGIFNAVGTVVDPFGNSASASTSFQVVDESRGADLVALSMTVSEAVADPQTLALSGTVSVSFKNGGSVHVAPGFEIAVFEDLNLDGTLTSAEDHLLGSVTFDKPLMAGEGSRATVPVFGQLRFRNNVLYAMVDARQIVAETDETNNVVRSLVECEGQACVAAPFWTAEGDQAGAGFGGCQDAIAAGDVNGDGFDDAIIGACTFDNGQQDEGAVFLFLGGPRGLSTAPAWRAEGNETESWFGDSVGAGDVNGDGFDDILIGASTGFNFPGVGRAFAYYGSPAGPFHTPDWVVYGPHVGSRFGFPIAHAGDVNGDGYGDVIVGAFGYSGGEQQEGRAYVFHGSASGLSTTPAWVVESNQTLAELGSGVDGAGDVNGDGYDDVVVGSWWFDNGQPDEGRAFVYHGSATGLSTTSAWTFESNQADALLGLVVRGAGDVNGDGFDDVVVASRRFDSEQIDEGRVYAFHGSPSGLSTTPMWTADGDQTGAEFGVGLDGGGDVNEDGFADVVVGAYLFDRGETDEGAAFVYLGSPSGLSSQYSWTADGDQPGALFGLPAGFAGDVNGDGAVDVIVGAGGFDNGQMDEGRAFVYVCGLGVAASSTSATDVGAPLTIATTSLTRVRARTYSLDADFDEGSLVGVNHDAPNHDQLQLNKVTTRFAFIWVAASARGTIVKISTETGQVLGEYLSAPNGRGRNPSRTTVDVNGNVWTGNRDEGTGGKGSVVKIGLLENHQCVDLNGNGIIDTSSGLGDIRPWANLFGVDSNGGVSSAEDECILVYKRVNGTHIRQVSIDANNDVWVGGHAFGDPRFFDLLDGETGAILRTINLNDPRDTGEAGPLNVGPYGGFVDGNGFLWASTLSGNVLLRIDPRFPNGHPEFILPIPLGRTSYGLGIDTNGIIWHANLEYNTVQKIRPDGIILGTFFTEGASGDRGVAVTSADNHIWVANSFGSDVSRLDNNGNLVAVIPLGILPPDDPWLHAPAGCSFRGLCPTGVAVDHVGKVWVTNLASSNVMRIDPATNRVDLTVDLRIPPGGLYNPDAGPYNYSDMTGGVLFGAVVGRGTWTVIHDSGAAGTNWGRVSWTSREPPGTSVRARARSADSIVHLSSALYVNAPNGTDIGVPNGRYLQVEVTLLANEAGASPVVFDVTISPGCEQDLTASRLTVDQTRFPDQVTLFATIGSGGAVPIPPGTPVAFYDGDPVAGGLLIGTTQSSRELRAGDSESVSLVWSLPPPGEHTIFVVADDDGTGARSLREESNFVNNIAFAVRNLGDPSPPPPTVVLVVPEGVQRTEEPVPVTVEVPAGNGAGEVETVLTVVNTTDPGVASLKVTLQDRGVFEIPLIFHAAGRYRLTAVATDGLDRTGTATASLVVEAPLRDTILPEIVILHVDGGPFVVGESKQIEFVAEDNDAVAFVTVVEDSGTFTFPGGGPFSLSVAPDAPGDYRVVFTAEDRSGNRASFVLSAVALDPEAPGPLPPLLTVQIDPDTIFPGESSTIRVDVRDPQEQAVTVTVAVGGELVPLISGVALYKSSPLFYGDFPVLVKATNQSGLSSQVRDILHILNPGDNTPPSVALSVDPTAAIVGEFITFRVFGSDLEGPVTLSLIVGGVNVPLDGSGTALYTSPTPGVFEVVAAATEDAGGRKATLMTSVEFFPLPDDVLLPVGDLGSLAYDALVSEPVDIIGTADDEHFAQYFLQYRRQGDVGFTTFASGTEPVINGLLGTFDPTILINGRYTVQLVVLDQSGQATISSTEVTVRSDVKLGNFTLTFSDLTVDVAGLPITIERTYDSRDKQPGDFGVGWTLSTRDFDLREDRDRNVTLTMPDGRRATFYFDLVNCGRFVIICAIWRAEPGVFATLTMAGDNGVLFSPLDGVLVGFVNDISFSYDCYPIPGYTLTMKEGTRYVLEKADLGLSDTICGSVFLPLLGEAELKTVVDLNGNTLEFRHEGIIHSAGKSVLFTRDPEDRVVALTDPRGEQVLYRYDAEGDLVGVTDQEGNETTFEYGPNHLLVNIRDPLGRVGIRNEYDDTGRLLAHVDAEGNRIEYEHRLDTRQEIVRDRLGNLTVYEYDARGDVVSQTDALRGRTEYAYDANRNEIMVRDPLERVTTRVYDPQGNLLFETDATGNRTSWTYNARGQVLTRTDARGNVTTFEYDDRGNLLREVDALGNVTTHEYSAMGNLERTVDALGHATMYEYDSFGYMTRMTDARGNVTTYTYDGNGNRLSETRMRTLPDGTTEELTTTFSYDGAGRLVATKNPDGSVRRTEYDELSRQRATIDELGRRTESEYDARGHLSATIYPDGTRETFGYDADGRQISRTDRAGRTILLAYDSLGRLVRTTFPDGATTTTTYDKKGNVLTQTDARGNVTTFTYDDLDRQTSITDALGNTTRSEYDANGNLIVMVDALGRRTTYVYDARNQRTRTVFPDDTFATTDYDSLGRRVAETDQDGKRTQFGYDHVGRLIKVTDATHQQWNYAYDEAGNMTTQTDANGNTTRFEYDRMGRQTARILPLGQRETRAYDEAGNLISKMDFNGRTITYTHDTNNQLIRKQFQDGSSHTFTYTPTGQRASATDSRGTTSYTYDVRARLVQVVHPDGSILSYTYDTAGNLLSVTTPSGTTAYTYDALNRLVSVRDPDGGVTTYTYDKVGNRLGMDYPNGTRARYRYDLLNRLTFISDERPDGTIFASYEYTLGPAGNRQRVLEHSGRTVAYEYDDLYRLVEEVITESGGAVMRISYSYDRVGNRLTKTDAAGTVSYTYDENDRLLAAGGVTFTYDDNGNTISQMSGMETTAYRYDDENHLVMVAPLSGAPTTYAYDSDGLRVEKTAASGTTNFLVDTNNLTGFAQVVRETNGAGVEVVRYTYGDDLISQSREGVISYYHHDGQMSTRQLTSVTGGVTDSYTYDAFGHLVASSGSTQNQYLYAGEQFDGATSFYYLRARYYSPASGRFLTADPATGSRFEPKSLHKYAYAHADPVNNLDPSGELLLLQAMTLLSIRMIDPLPGLPGFLARSLIVHLAERNASALASRAVRALARWDEQARDRYEKWFGEPTPERELKVILAFHRVFVAIEYLGVEYDFSQRECSPETRLRGPTVARVLPPGADLEIHICQPFWNYPPVGSDSQASILVHELIHEVLESYPHLVFGNPVEGARHLAANLPEEAVQEAYNYQFFAESASGWRT